MGTTKVDPHEPQRRGDHPWQNPEGEPSGLAHEEPELNNERDIPTEDEGKPSSSRGGTDPKAGEGVVKGIAKEIGIVRPDE